MFKVKNTRPYPKSLNLTYLSNQVQKQKMGFFDDIVDRGQEAVDDAVDTVTGGDDDEDEPSQESDTGSEPNQATEDFVDEYGPGDDSGGSDSSNDSVSDVVNDAPSDTGSDSSPEQDFVDRYGGGSDDSDDDTGGGGGSYYEDDDDDDGRDPDPPDNTADNDPDTVDTAETSTGTDTQTDDRPGTDVQDEISEAEQTRVQVQKTRDDILASYKDDREYRLDPDELSDRQQDAIGYEEPDRTVGDPNIILSGNELENRLVDDYNQQIREIDRFIDQAEDFQEQTRNTGEPSQTNEPVLSPLNQPTVNNFNNENDGFVENFTENPAETTLRSGVGVMQFGQNQLQQPVTDFFDRFDQPRLGTAPIRSGPPRQSDIAQQIEQDRETTEVLENQIGPGDDITGVAAGGAATSGTQLGGLAIATPGAIGTSFREDTPGLGESAAAGPGLVKDEFTDNPGEFIASEAGEELGEAAVFGAATGGIGLAAAAVPTPEFTVTPETSTPSEDFTVEETPEAREFDEAGREDLPQLQDQSLDRDPQAPMIRDDITGLQGDQRIGQEPGQSTAPLEQEQGLTIGDIEALAGREITPAERADIEARLRQEDFQRVGNVREIVQDALNNPNALGSGPGALVPPETTQEPDIEFEQDFVENDLRTDPMLEQETEPDTDLGVFDSRPQNTQPERQGFDTGTAVDESLLPQNPSTLDPEISEEQRPGQSQQPGQGQNQDQPFDFEPGEFLGPDFVNPENEQSPEPEPTPGTPRIDQGTFDFDPEPTPGQDNTPDSRGGSDSEGFTFEDFEEDVDFQEEEGRFAESLTAGLFNIQADEGFEEEEFVGTGFGVRPLTDDEV